MEIGVISFENGVNTLNSDYECFCHFNGMNPALLSLVILSYWYATMLENFVCVHACHHFPIIILLGYWK